MRLVLLALWAWSWATPAFAQDFPKLTGRVVDAADVLSPRTEQALTLRLSDWESESSDQVVVATVPDLQGLDVADYGYRLGRHWGLGVGEAADGRELNNGVLLLVAPNDRAVTIEVGYGLEGTLTDTESHEIVQEVLLPAFRTGDYDQGVIEGVASIVELLSATPEEAAERRRRAGDRPIARGAGEGGLPWPLILFGSFFLLSLWPRRRRGRVVYDSDGRRRRRRRSSVNDLATGLVLGQLLNGGRRGGGFSSGGFGGSGGFSGGGGSFGGGGASGSW